MRKSCFPAVALGLGLLAGSGRASAAELRLTFPGLRPEGRVAYAVYADAPSWSRRAGAVKAGTIAVGEDVVLSLPPGVYGVMAYHDRDDDRKLDTLPIGLPTEPYGFSNDARGPFGPPGWRAASFRLDEPGGRQTLRLR